MEVQSLAGGRAKFERVLLVLAVALFGALPASPQALKQSSNIQALLHVYVNVAPVVSTAAIHPAKESAQSIVYRVPVSTPRFEVLESTKPVTECEPAFQSACTGVLRTTTVIAR